MGHCPKMRQIMLNFSKFLSTSSVSTELLQGFARSLALVANWQNITLLSINMKANWRASFLKSCEQANQCNNSGEREEVFDFILTLYNPNFTFYPVSSNA